MLVNRVSLVVLLLLTVRCAWARPNPVDIGPESTLQAFIHAFDNQKQDCKITVNLRPWLGGEAVSQRDDGGESRANRNFQETRSHYYCRGRDDHH